ncbi:hypothetical protein ANRL1_01413 [Anaerolineae bacterium]|nr:hypothetical protein ANRL1_01413 [Anaerolineae bacterium]
MPRIRGLKPDTFKDEDLANLPVPVRYFFMGLWCYADKLGRLEDRPKYLKAELFAYDDFNVEAALELLANPQIQDRPNKVFIRRYTVNGRKYLDIPNFLKHQRPHHTEKGSVIPSFEESLTVKAQLDSGESQEESVVCSLNIEKEKESVHREGEGDGKGGRGEGRTEQKTKALSLSLEDSDSKKSEADIQKRKDELRRQVEALKASGLI